MLTHTCRMKRTKKLLLVWPAVLILYILYSWYTFHSDIDYFGDESCMDYQHNKNPNARVSDDEDSVQQKTETFSKNIHAIIEEAIKVSSFNRTVLMTLVNDAYLQFADSWLCNTKPFGIHEAILVVTTSDTARKKLKNAWPDIHVVSMNVGVSSNKQDYSTAGYVKIMIHRAELFQALLDAGLEVMLFEFDYVWFKNPVPNLQTMNDVDLLVNPVSETNNKIINGGLLYLFPTERTKTIWRELTCRLDFLGRVIQHRSATAPVAEEANDQVFLSRLVYRRYANITTRTLSLDTYADGKWYSSSEETRRFWKPVMISNNWVIGIDNKIKRAKQFGHWFLKDDGTCDTEQILKVIS